MVTIGEESLWTLDGRKNSYSNTSSSRVSSLFSIYAYVYSSLSNKGSVGNQKTRELPVDFQRYRARLIGVY